MLSIRNNLSHFSSPFIFQIFHWRSFIVQSNRVDSGRHTIHIQWPRKKCKIWLPLETLFKLFPPQKEWGSFIPIFVHGRNLSSASFDWRASNTDASMNLTYLHNNYGVAGSRHSIVRHNFNSSLLRWECSTQRQKRWCKKCLNERKI